MDRRYLLGAFYWAPLQSDRLWVGVQAKLKPSLKIERRSSNNTQLCLFTLSYRELTKMYFFGMSYRRWMEIASRRHRKIVLKPIENLKYPYLTMRSNPHIEYRFRIYLLVCMSWIDFVFQQAFCMNDYAKWRKKTSIIVNFQQENLDLKINQSINHLIFAINFRPA